MSARSHFQRMNRRREDGYRVLKNESTSGEADIFIYDQIGEGWFGGVTAKQFTEDLRALDASVINLHLNSPGGSVFEGTTIYNALRQHSAKIITHVDGLAASIASIIALAGDEVRMAKNAFMMIHDPWTFSMGDAGQLRKDASVLDKIGDMLVQTYAATTNKDAKEIKNLMKAETWFTAEEAVEIGLATSIVEESLEAAAGLFNLSMFSNVPKGLDIAAMAVETPSIRDVERVLRDAGYSRSEAKAISAKGASALSEQRDAGTEELTAGLSSLLTSIKSSLSSKE